MALRQLIAAHWASLSGLVPPMQVLVGYTRSREHFSHEAQGPVIGKCGAREVLEDFNMDLGDQGVDCHQDFRQGHHS